MRRALNVFMVIIGALTTTGLLVLSGVGIWFWQSRPESTIAEASILRLDLSGTLADSSTTDPLSTLLSEPSPTLRATIEAIDRAALDSRIAGLIVDLSHTRPTLAAAQELRSAVARFRAAGKYTAVFADSFSERERATQAYLLATAFERIWMQPSGALDITGLRAETPFFADLLKTVGVQAEFSQRHEFKGAADGFRLNRMDPAMRSSLTSLLDDLHRQIVDGVSESRKIAKDEVANAISQAPLFADEALARRLIDRIGYRDQLLTNARQTLGGGNPVLDFARYAAETTPEAPVEDARLIAVIALRGAIVRGKMPDGGSLSGDQTYGDTAAAAIDAAARDRRVAAILLRIDSPGGSYVASDTVWRAVKMARTSGKPVVASLGGVAASGGYFIAMAADKIIAEPATVTGSIGVVGGKFVVGNLLDKLGIHVEPVDSAPNAGFYSALTPFTTEQKARFEESLDRIYADFTNRVATERKLTAAKLDGVARGRIWTGAQAIELGLVDGLGGIDTAVVTARKLADLSDLDQAAVVAYPPPEAPWKRLVRSLQRFEEAGIAFQNMIGYMAPSLAWLRRATITLSRGDLDLGRAVDF